MGKYKTLRDAIYTIVNTNLVGSTKPLVSVNKTHNLVEGGFPYVTIAPSEMPSDFATNAENIRTYSFDLYIWTNVEDVDIGEANALNSIMDITDQIVDLIDADFTLSGNAEAGVVPLPAEIRVFDGPAGKMIGSKIVIRCRTLHQFV